jgi:transcriptional regulator with XRE-family HTH domain
MRDARLAAGISQGDLSERSGYCRESISSWECGKINIKLFQFIDVCQVLGIRVRVETD